ncbi:hydrolase, UxaA family [Salmonella enterica subsp. enterica]|uniref:Hydrolase, UxaA family n=1 Tax=Salmonella enterica I TaxID=59201 RepID=A0A3S4KDL4_SALET|nr:hydrolase, UxaA family [Salmonella enterica subsp. enterica]
MRLFWVSAALTAVFGIRNYVLILPTSVCANKVAQDIARQVKGATWVNNDFWLLPGGRRCASDGKDID